MKYLNTYNEALSKGFLKKIVSAGISDKYDAVGLANKLIPGLKKLSSEFSNHDLTINYISLETQQTKYDALISISIKDSVVIDLIINSQALYSDGLKLPVIFIQLGECTRNIYFKPGKYIESEYINGTLLGIVDGVLSLYKEYLSKNKSIEFFNTLSEDEIKDLVINISDILGECTINKNDYGEGEYYYFIEFDYKFKSINNDILINQQILTILSELSDISEKIKGLYSFETLYLMSSNGLTISIYPNGSTEKFHNNETY